MLLKKNNNLLTTVSLGGSLKIFDLTKDRSWINSLILPQTHEFKITCIAAATNTGKVWLGNVVILVFNNKQFPYVYINCSSEKDYKQQT